MSESVDSIEGSVSCAEHQGCSIMVPAHAGEDIRFRQLPFGYLTKVVLLFGQVEYCQMKHVGCVESRQLSLVGSHKPNTGLVGHLVARIGHSGQVGGVVGIDSRSVGFYYSQGRSTDLHQNFGGCWRQTVVGHFVERRKNRGSLGTDER